MGGLLHLVQRGWDWAGPQSAQAPPRCIKCNSPSISGQCTNHRIHMNYGSLLCGLMCPLNVVHLFCKLDGTCNMIKSGLTYHYHFVSRDYTLVLNSQLDTATQPL